MIASIFFPHQRNPIQFSICKLLTTGIILYAFYILLNTSFTLLKEERQGVFETSEMKKTLAYNSVLAIFILLLTYIFVGY